MPKALDPETRQAIENAIRKGAGTVSRARIAREFEVAPSTVGKIAKDAGLTDAFARTQTENATRARTVDLADRRARLAERMLELAERFSTRAVSPYEIVVATKDDVHHVTLDEPPLGDVRQAMTAAGIAIDKHIALVRFDTKDGANGAALSLVDALIAGFGVHPDAEGDVDDGYPVPLPSAAQIAEDAAALSEAAAAAGEATS